VAADDGTVWILEVDIDELIVDGLLEKMLLLLELESACFVREVDCVVDTRLELVDCVEYEELDVEKYVVDFVIETRTPDETVLVWMDNADSMVILLLDDVEVMELEVEE
jgi:hypothetical protein